MRIVPLVEVPEALGALARIMEAEWPDWYAVGGKGDARADLVERCRDTGLPRGVVAMEGALVLGGAALASTSFGAEPGEGPWIVGLVVAPAARRQGIGSALVAALEVGTGSIWATTRAAEGLFLRRGWCVLRRIGDQAVLRRDPPR